MAGSYALNPIGYAWAQTPAVSPDAALAALKKFTGTIAHADDYGPFIATVTNG